MEQVLFEQNNQILFFIYVTSGALGAVISGYFFKFYDLFSSSYIFALAIGFSFVSFADFFFSATIESVIHETAFNMLHWLQLFVLSFGFVFIGSVYYFQKSTEKRLRLVTNSALLSLGIIGLAVLIIGIQDIQNFPRFQQYNEYFRILNMCVLGYVFFKLVNNSELKIRKDLILMPLGFGILFLGQFERFLFSIDPSSLTLVTSGVLMVAGLGVIIIGMQRKAKPMFVEKLTRHEP